MRMHVFNYKCTLCDMSCESPSSLATHVRYRHVSTRSFPCQLCNHAAKSQQDLDSHMTVHTSGPNFSCHFDGCLYKCKGAYTLDRYMCTDFLLIVLINKRSYYYREIYFKAHRTSSWYASTMVLLSRVSNKIQKKL